MANYWMADKTKSVIEERKDVLKLLIDFANLDSMPPKNQVLQTRIFDLLYQHQALHPDNRGDKSQMENADVIIKSIYVHLRSRFEEIFQKNTTMELWDDLPLWSITGSIQLFIDPKSNCFHEKFQFHKVEFKEKNGESGKELDGIEFYNVFRSIGLFSNVLDLTLIETIRDMDLSRRHFCKCIRCNKFFYNSTKKMRDYCSTKCTNAVRQKNYRKGKEDKVE